MFCRHPQPVVDPRPVAELSVRCELHTRRQPTALATVAAHRGAESKAPTTAPTAAARVPGDAAAG